MFGSDKFQDFAEIIDVADRVAFMLDPKDAALNQVEGICDAISELAGNGVSSTVTEAFLRFAEKEYVWMEVLHQPEIFLHYITDERSVTLDDAIVLARFMSRIIDFKALIQQCIPQEFLQQQSDLLR